ncbi:MAG: carbohydrate kinase [Rhodanobacter sp.]|nr:MAG: carbohydrate kinase [Rhodanobacter sp.]
MFLICGEALYDVFTESAAGNTLPMRARPGGSPFNVAIGLARLGSAAALLGGLSNDALGQHLVDILQREGVCPDYLMRRPERTTLSMVALDANGVAQYTFYGEHGADRAPQQTDLPALQPGVHCLHMGSYTLVTEPIASAMLTLARRERGRRMLSLDPNVRPTVEPDMSRWRDQVEAMAALAHLVKVSEEDLQLLYPQVTPEGVARRWLEGGTRLVVVTLGGDGAMALSSTLQARVAGKQVAVADTVGAGDSFQAALLHQLPNFAALDAVSSNVEAMSRLLEFAVTAAGITCTRPGADPPTLPQVEAALR